MKKIFLVAAAAFLFFSVFSHSIRASENFAISADVIYTINENGVTNVNFNVNLTNKVPNSYASSYKIQLGFSDIKNIRVSDEGGAINPIVTKTDEGNSIELASFNKKVVGEGAILSFSLQFDTNDVAKKQGSIWEINIPGLSNQSDFSNFAVRVKTPQSFGKPAYVKPEFSKILSYQNNTLNFTKDQLKKSGISIAYGEKQIYGFTLSYHLKNNNLFPVKTEIALPPTTNYQEVFIENITPSPANVTLDSDGNWLAQYSLFPSEKKDIEVKGSVEVSLYPKREILSEIDSAPYLVEKQYWQTKNDEIKKLADSLKTPAAIYQYLVKNLTYDYSRVTDSKPRLGALNVLKDPTSAVCLEFTDLFVTLARAAGIPAREVDGFAYTENSKQRPLSLVKDILHAWPEYYDRELQTWVMVDPTWGNTTGGVDYFNVLDFDHIAFSIKGYNSSYPVPAGGYKISGFENTKDVSVYFTTKKTKSNENILFTSSVAQKQLSGLPIRGSLRIDNRGESMIGPQTITIQARRLRPATQKISIGVIPPFGYIESSFSFEKTPFLTNEQDTITILAGQKSIQNKIEISPIFLTRWTILGGVISASIVIFIVSIITKKLWRISFFRRKG